MELREVVKKPDNQWVLRQEHAGLFIEEGLAIVYVSKDDMDEFGEIAIPKEVSVIDIRAIIQLAANQSNQDSISMLQISDVYNLVDNMPIPELSHVSRTRR